MKIFMNWSGGKDSALALYKVKQQGINVEALVTSMNSVTNRVLMHGVRRELLEHQAAALDLQLLTVELAEMPGIKPYENAMHKMHRELKKNEFTHALFGDIFLEDLKHYREALLAKDDLQCVFPLWKMDGAELMKEFFSLGFKAIVICIDNSVLDKSFCGRMLDESFLADLPPCVDICGENGEYHSFVFDGPIFSSALNIQKGELIFKEFPSPKKDDCFTTPKQSAGFWFCDVLLST
jgi:uncharacterized protein (TIGR00290 family)